jgi:hypothetical protein
LEETLQQILHNQQTLQATQQTFQQNLTTLATEITQIRANQPPPGFGRPPPTPDGTQPFNPSSIKLEIPKFDGSDPMNWIFKITQFFDYHQTPDAQRLRLASFYMEGEALTWYQWMHTNGQLVSWPMFIHALELRFAPSQYEDPQGSLFKLCQTASVKEYQTAFEALVNRIIGLPAPFYLSCFVSGLKPEIRREVLAFQPISLSHAISLAKLQEEKLNDLPTQPPPRRPTTHFPPPNALTTTKPPFRTFPPPLQPTTPPQTATPIKRLSPQELQARREKGLCYNCDDKFVKGHRCKRSFNILIAHPDEASSSQDPITQLLLEAPPDS